MFWFVAAILLGVSSGTKLDFQKPRDIDTSVNVTHLSSTFYKGKLSSVDPYTIKYYKIYQCNEAAASKSMTKLTIIQPDNTAWDTTSAYVAAEVSTCETAFDDSCVFATNYYYSANPSAFSTVVWSNTFNSSTSNDSWIYLRFIGRITAVEYTFELSYVSDTDAVTGTFSFDMFESTTVTSSDYNYAKQYIKSLSSYSVTNFEAKYFFLYFCANDFDSDDEFIVTISAVSTPDAPESAMNLYGCPESYGTSECTINNADATQNEDATSVVVITMTNSDSEVLTDGIYVIVYGTGGATDKENTFLLSATLTFDD